MLNKGDKDCPHPLCTACPGLILTALPVHLRLAHAGVEQDPGDNCPTPRGYRWLCMTEAEGPGDPAGLAALL